MHRRAPRSRCRTLVAAIALGCLVAAAFPGAPGAAAPAQGAVDCAQLAAALVAAPALTHYPVLAAAAGQCGESSAPSPSSPTCSQLTAAFAAAPWLAGYPGPQRDDQACAAATTQPQASSQPFDDLTGFDWAANAIDQLAALGVLQGVGGQRFAPGDPLTRAEFAALLQRTFHLQAPQTPATFSDVPSDAWYAAAVAAAARYMASGATFDPQGPVTRIVAAASLGAVLVAEGGTVDTLAQAQAVWAGFADGALVPAASAVDAATAVTAGLMVGEGATFGVNDPLNRAQAAVLFLRVIQQPGAPAASGGQTSATAATPVWKGPPTSASAIPIGDGHVSTTPAVGYVDSCTTSFKGGGAQHVGPWLNAAANTWSASAKIDVQGAVTWPAAAHAFTIQGSVRVLSTNDLPQGATTGIFPISPSDPAYAYDHNPNAIVAQSLIYDVPATPVAASAPSCLGLGPIGVMVNGVLLFDALDAAGRDAGAHEVQDSCDGHPQSQGMYHYHFVSTCLPHGAAGTATLVGYALDGYGIYVERDAQGSLPTNADLDACHGRTSVVPWDGKPTLMYHYDATMEYPYTLGCYHGTPAVARRGG